jgi:formylmethanofuran dehydrogenase subunit E
METPELKTHENLKMCEHCGDIEKSAESFIEADLEDGARVVCPPCFPVLMNEPRPLRRAS